MGKRERVPNLFLVPKNGEVSLSFEIYILHKKSSYYFTYNFPGFGECQQFDLLAPNS